VREDLARLILEHPLPEGVADPDLYADVVTIAGVNIHRVGLSCRVSGAVEITGSAAEVAEEPLNRAYFELLERAAVILADEGNSLPPGVDGTATSGPPRIRPARSNGVALHRTWEEACMRAHLELVERDRVLRSWYGELLPVPARVPSSLERFVTHEWCACSIAESSAADRDIAVAAIIGFPLHPGGSLARGFAGRGSLDQALEAAAVEALQGLAFLLDEALPAEPPEASPTPMFHLDYYLWPAHHVHLRNWLRGAHTRSGALSERSSSDETRYLDLTPAGFGALRVARAVRRGARPLEFGDAPASLAAGLPGSHIHPIS
jgi:hypothetical protein